MMYGLVRAGTTSKPPQQSDLDGAKRVALAAYRHFLAGEEAFRALTSRAVPVDWPGAAAVEPPPPDHRLGRAGVVAGALVVLVALVGWFFLRSGGEPTPCAPATAVVVESPAPATCPPPPTRPPGR
jgi:hypothetical protein